MKNLPAEFWIAFWCTVIGFIIGGGYGEIASSGFHPSCWIGAAAGFVIGIGGCICPCFFD